MTLLDVFLVLTVMGLLAMTFFVTQSRNDENADSKQTGWRIDRDRRRYHNHDFEDEGRRRETGDRSTNGNEGVAVGDNVERCTFAEVVDEYIERSDKLREQWHCCDSDIAATAIDDQLEAMADDFARFHAYEPKTWCAKRLRDVITQGVSYEAAIRAVMETRRMSR